MAFNSALIGTSFQIITTIIAAAAAAAALLSA
jgi:hypothetical protein